LFLLPGRGDIFHRALFFVEEKLVASLQELLAQKAAIEKQIIETQRNERAEAIARVRALMAEHGLTAADIAAKATGTAKPPTRKVAPKFRNPQTGETWTGRGLQPKWLKAALAQGKKLGDFAL
jgi:DNA-binding protein H-NS